MERTTTAWLGAAAVGLVAVIGLGVYLGSDSETPSAPPPPPPAPVTQPNTIPEGSRLPQDAPTPVDEAAWQTSESGLRWADIVVGPGELAEHGAPLVIEYTGWLAETGEMFDSSKRRSRPLVLTLGHQDAPMPGWDEAVTGMRVGGKRQAVFPPELAFGQTGRPPRVPRNATVIFEFELKSTAPHREAPDAPPEFDPSQLIDLDGVQFVTLSAGEGRTLQQGDHVALDYSAFLAVNGKLFDSSLNRQGPARFTFGAREMLEGVEVGIRGMKLGEKRLLRIPSALGYGANGLRNYVPPDAELLFVVEVVEITDQ